MKKPFSFLAAAVAALGAVSLAAALTGCGDTDSKNITMDEPASVTRVAEALRQNVDPAQDKLTKIAWYEGEELTSELSYVLLSSLGPDDEAYTRRIVVAGNGIENGHFQAAERERLRINFNKSGFADAKFLTADDLDPDAIMKQIEQAVPMIDAEIYDVRSVANYWLEIDSASGEKRAGLMLRIANKKGATERTGKHEVTTYYEVRFDVRPDGSVAMIEE